jgi:hypothetical protein
VDGGPHEVAVALLAGPGGEETLAASPSGLLCVVRLEGLLGEAVGGVVDGDDGVGDTITPISAVSALLNQRCGSAQDLLFSY